MREQKGRSVRSRERPASVNPQAPYSSYPPAESKSPPSSPGSDTGSSNPPFPGYPPSAKMSDAEEDPSAYEEQICYQDSEPPPSFEDPSYAQQSAAYADPPQDKTQYAASYPDQGAPQANSNSESSEDDDHKPAPSQANRRSGYGGQYPGYNPAQPKKVKSKSKDYANQGAPLGDQYQGYAQQVQPSPAGYPGSYNTPQPQGKQKKSKPKSLGPIAESPYPPYAAAGVNPAYNPQFANFANSPYQPAPKPSKHSKSAMDDPSAGSYPPYPDSNPSPKASKGPKAPKDGLKRTKSSREVCAKAAKQQIKELYHAAALHYREMSQNSKLNLQNMFTSMDVYKLGRARFPEVKRSLSNVNLDRLLSLIDKDESGDLDFWEFLCLRYVLKSKKSCDQCGEIILGVVFSCVECFRRRGDPGVDTYDICLPCFDERKFRHPHSVFLDESVIIANTPQVAPSPQPNPMPRSGSYPGSNNFQPNNGPQGGYMAPNPPGFGQGRFGQPQRQGPPPQQPPPQRQGATFLDVLNNVSNLLQNSNSDQPQDPSSFDDPSFGSSSSCDFSFD